MSKPIVFVEIRGGLGNQLFQIAAAYAYAKRENAQLQIHRKTRNGNRPVYWETIFKKTYPYLVDRVPSTKRWSEKYPTVYQELPPIPPTGLQLHGFFQSSKYFCQPETIREIKELFKPDDVLLQPILNKYAFLMQPDVRERVVVVHARRTDYLLYAANFGPLSVEYYKEAVNRICAHVNQPIFVLSSDDNQFWTEIRDQVPIIFEHTHTIIENESDIHTFVLLQHFRYFIMSNSSFIWWIVFLADAKHVTVPSRWFGPKGPPYPDIFESSWEKIESTS